MEAIRRSRNPRDHRYRGRRRLCHVPFRAIKLTHYTAGSPLDVLRAENLAAQCGELREQIVDPRNVIRLSATATGIHGAVRIWSRARGTCGVSMDHALSRGASSRIVFGRQCNFAKKVLC